MIVGVQYTKYTTERFYCYLRKGATFDKYARPKETNRISKLTAMSYLDY